MTGSNKIVVVSLCLTAGLMFACQGTLGSGGDADTDGADGDGTADSAGDTQEDSLPDGMPDGVEDTHPDSVEDTPADTPADTDVDVEVPEECGNGVVDEGEDCDPEHEASRSCDTACGSTGTQPCTAECEWGACEPPDEACNGEDDDCDGTDDNGFECVRGSGEVCFTYCGSGISRTCGDACTWGECGEPEGACSEIIVPYGEDPYPPVLTLVFDTSIKIADVYFLVDTTGTMYSEISGLKTGISGTIIPGLAGAVRDIRMGVGHFEDYPVTPYGSSGDTSYENLANLDADPESMAAGVAALYSGGGNDYPESHVTALWTVARGDPAPTMPRQPEPACEGSQFGYPCFRRGSLPVILLFTDAPFHNGPRNANPYGEGIAAPSYDETVTALVEENIKVIAVFSGTTGDRAHTNQLVVDTGAVTDGGSPVVRSIPADGAGLSDAVVGAFEELVTQVPLSVTARAWDDPTDEIEATEFIARIETNVTDSVEDPDNPGVFCVTGLAVDDVSGDGFDDTFTGVLPGTAVCFDIIPARNESVPSTGEEQTARAFIEIIGDGTTSLDVREIFFIVP
ncbi:MAG: hypothetical protein ABIJ56_17635 [Pseudomonadota bacterium]